MRRFPAGVIGNTRSFYIDLNCLPAIHLMVAWAGYQFLPAHGGTSMALKKLLLVCVSGFVLASCQGTKTYQRIGYGPELEVSQARCEIGAMSTEQGYFAMGSAGYVLGASIGNAISNEIRKQEFIKRCMVLQGWQELPPGQEPIAAAVQPQPAGYTAPALQASPTAPASPGHRPSTPSHLGPPLRVVAAQ